MFTAVHRFFATANLALTLGNLELALEDILGPSASIIHPAGDSEVGFLHNLLDDRRGGRKFGNGTGSAKRAGGGLHDTAWRTDENFSLTAGDLSFTLSNVTLALCESLGPFGSDISPNAFVYSRLRIGNDVCWRDGGSS